MKFQRFVIVKLFYFSIFSLVEGKNVCKNLDYLPCIQNKTLTGHVIKSFRVLVPGLKMCQSKCFTEGQCVSYNLGPVDGQIRTCELSAADHWSSPDALVSKNGSEYCPIKGRCSAAPCPGNKPICHPDFALDTFTCTDGIWSQWGPWEYCNCPILSRNRSCLNATRDPATDCGPEAAKQTKEDYSRCPRADPACSDALGMENGEIRNEQISASSHYGKLYSHYARLNREATSADDVWCANNKRNGEYVEINLTSIKKITKIAIQGRRYFGGQHFTQYSLKYSNDGNNWEDYGPAQIKGCPVKIFPGNNDGTSVVTNEISPPIRTQYIRIVVFNYYIRPCTRLELYGC